ncbi:MAG: GspH/FimT family protein [Gammaproteobacteria bacterium]|jgi:type IV fimbrial biogenesis protein FimT
MQTRVSAAFPLPENSTFPQRFSFAMHKGFTIIELIIALAALGILLAIGLPSFQDTVEDVNTNARVKELITSLSLARSEAVKRGTDVHLCATNSAGSDCAAGQWSVGWIVFEDANGDANGAAGSIDAGDEIIRVFGAGRSPSAITFTAALVTFNSMGFNATGTSQEFEIFPGGSIDSHARCIQLSAVGRPLRIEGECP